MQDAQDEGADVQRAAVVHRLREDPVEPRLVVVRHLSSYLKRGRASYSYRLEEEAEHLVALWQAATKIWIYTYYYIFYIYYVLYIIISYVIGFILDS